MKHVLAAASLHDGGGIFSLAWSFVAIPLGLAMMRNPRGMAELIGRPDRGMKPLLTRIVGGFFFVFGIFAISEAIHRFYQGGY